MLFMSFGVVAVCVSAFALSVIRDTAVEGARFAALADQSTNSGCLRSQSLIEKTLGPAFGKEITCSAKKMSGVDYESVRIQISLPLIGLFKGNHLLYAESSAPREIQ
jgi:hypothetical protein